MKAMNKEILIHLVILILLGLSPLLIVWAR